MNDPNVLGLVPSVYFAESLVRCDIGMAWRILLDYTTWNPSYAGATVTRIEGAAGTEGELVLISNNWSYAERTGFPPYYARTVKLVPGRRVVWYCYAKEGLAFQDQQDPFRNFVDFGLTPEGGGIRFLYSYYQQTRQTDEAITRERQFLGQKLQATAHAFRDYCERHGGVAQQHQP